jgi:hypothetical protein
MVLVFFMFALVPIISQADAHSAFNSAEQVVGDYRVKIATLPEFPNVGETSQILIRVLDDNFNEVDRFTMGIRVFYKDVQVDTITPKSYEGGRWEIDYIFERSGNHVFRVDLYDAAEDGGVLTYTFNMSTQSPFGYIFFYSIMTGSVILAGFVGYIYLPKKFKKLKSKF